MIEAVKMMRHVPLQQSFSLLLAELMIEAHPDQRRQRQYNNFQSPISGVND